MHLCDELKQEKFDGAVIDAATALQQMLTLSADGFVVAHKSNNERLIKCGGVSVYIPAPPEIGLSRYYAKVDFAKQSSWSTFLQAVKNS